MKHNKNSRIKNIEKVRTTIKELDNNFFSISEIIEKTGLNHEQVKRILHGFEEIGIVKYMESTRVYVRV